MMKELCQVFSSSDGKLISRDDLCFVFSSVTCVACFVVGGVFCGGLFLFVCFFLYGFFLLLFKEKGCKDYLFMLQHENSLISTPP